jgi:hypothetical protein
LGVGEAWVASGWPLAGGADAERLEPLLFGALGVAGGAGASEHVVAVVVVFAGVVDFG